jgi:hypothetical protein
MILEVAPKTRLLSMAKNGGGESEISVLVQFQDR